MVLMKIDNSGVKKFRFCVHYRRFYHVTIPDKYPLPLTDSILDKLGRQNISIQWIGQRHINFF